jgi:hypothetical protein
MSEQKLMNALKFQTDLLITMQEEMRAQFAELAVKVETTLAGERTTKKVKRKPVKPNGNATIDAKSKAVKKYSNAMYFFVGMYVTDDKSVSTDYSKETVDVASKQTNVLTKTGVAAKKATALHIWKTFDSDKKSSIKAKFDKWKTDNEKANAKNVDTEPVSDSDK